MAQSFRISRRLWLVLGLLLLPSAASAHTALKRSAPAKDSRLDTAPVRITLWFTARPHLAFSSITLVGPGGEVPLGPLAADTADAITADIARPLAAGSYSVRWQTAGADGHPIRGEFAFTVLASDPRLRAMPPGQQDSAAARAARVEQDGEMHTTRPELRSIRWMEFIALLTILGALGFRGIVLPALASRGVSVADASDRARRLGQSAVGLYAIAAVIRLYVQSEALAGQGNALATGSLRTLVLGTTWGTGWAAGAIGALLVFAGWKLSKRYGFGLVLVIAGSLGLVVAPGMTGHAAAAVPAAPAIALDAGHVAAAGLWVGGLLVVVFVGIPAMLRIPADSRDSAISALINSFHPLALLCAPLVLLTGVGSAWIRFDGQWSALLTSEYGRMLLWKLAFVAVVLMLGTYNSARVRRRLGTQESTRHVRLTTAIELLFAVIVVAVTTALLVTPLPTDLGVQ